MVPGPSLLGLLTAAQVMGLSDPWSGPSAPSLAPPRELRASQGEVGEGPEHPPSLVVAEVDREVPVFGRARAHGRRAARAVPGSARASPCTVSTGSGPPLSWEKKNFFAALGMEPRAMHTPGKHHALSCTPASAPAAGGPHLLPQRALPHPCAHSQTLDGGGRVGPSGLTRGHLDSETDRAVAGRSELRTPWPWPRCCAAHPLPPPSHPTCGQPWGSRGFRPHAHSTLAFPVSSLHDAILPLAPGLASASPGTAEGSRVGLWAPALSTETCPLGFGDSQMGGEGKFRGSCPGPPWPLDANPKGGRGTSSLLSPV